MTEIPMRDPIATGRQVLTEEARALDAQSASLGREFHQAVQWILGCEGRTIACGIGKSGHIARKVAGTLASTGTPSLFLHAAEAVHGDLGMVTAKDVLLLYTHSGETDEIVRLFPSLKVTGAKTILLTGRPGSSAANLSDLVLDTGVREEACHHNLAPTTSTTAMLALSDALAIAVMEARGFGRQDFARFHPAGALGKRLLLRVRDVMRSGEDIALVSPNATVLEAMSAMGKAGVGAAIAVSSSSELEGFASEGDLRRHLLATQDVQASISGFMNRSPKTVEPELMAVEALELFQNFAAPIGELPVVEEDRVVGLLMLKDLLRSGIV